MLESADEVNDVRMNANPNMAATGSSILDHLGAWIRDHNPLVGVLRTVQTFLEEPDFLELHGTASTRIVPNPRGRPEFDLPAPRAKELAGFFSEIAGAKETPVTGIFVFKSSLLL